MELLKDYDYMILYYSWKGNMVVDVLSYKLIGGIAHIIEARRSLMSELMHKLEASGAKLEIEECFCAKMVC